MVKFAMPWKVNAPILKDTQPVKASIPTISITKIYSGLSVTSHRALVHFFQTIHRIYLTWILQMSRVFLTSCARALVCSQSTMTSVPTLKMIPKATSKTRRLTIFICHRRSHILEAATMKTSVSKSTKKEVSSHKDIFSRVVSETPIKFQKEISWIKPIQIKSILTALMISLLLNSQ